jgi:hypothetical protein
MHEQVAQLEQKDMQLKLSELKRQDAVATVASMALAQQSATSSHFHNATIRRSRPRRRPQAPRRTIPSAPRTPAFATGAGTGGTSAGAALVSPLVSTPWRNAMSVIVDNNSPAAAKDAPRDVPDCGAGGKPPCLTIRYGVSRALPSATVTVRGGGAPYRGECGGASDALSSAMGIRPPGGASLKVEGAGGPVIIDCESNGRAFRFNGSSTYAAAVPGTGAKLHLAWLEVRNGKAPTAWNEPSGGAVWAAGGGELELEGCAFSDCTAPAIGGAVFALDVQLSIRNSGFTRCSATAGGGLFLDLMANLADLVAASIDGCDFTETHADAGGGAYIVSRGIATNTTIRVRNSTFTKSTAIKKSGGGFAGGLNIQYVGATDGAITDVDTCDFSDTHSNYVAGGAYLHFAGSATNTMARVRGCRFTNSTALAKGVLTAGGGLAILYNSPTEGATTVVDACAFSSTKTDYAGGGAYIEFRSSGINTETSVRDSNFTGSTAIFGDGSGAGAGMSIELGAGATFRNTSIDITDSTFTNNTSDGDAGGLDLNMAAESNVGLDVLVDGVRFDGNVASFNGDGGNGGGMMVFVVGECTAFSLAVQNSVFVNNTARDFGGGMNIAMPDGVPQSLRFVGNPDVSLWRTMESGDGEHVPGNDDDAFKPVVPYSLPQDLDNPCSGCGAFPNGCTSCPQFQPQDVDGFPINALYGVYRSWTEPGTLTIRDSYFAGNTAGQSSGAVGVVGGGSCTFENTTVESNHVLTFSGGGVDISDTVRLTVSNSTLRQNTCGSSSCQVSTTSGAGMSFENGSVVELGCGTDGVCKAGFTAAQVGKVEWTGGSAMTCPSGYQLLDSSLLGYETTLSDWTLEPPLLYPPNCDQGSAERQPGHKHHTPFHSNCTVLQNRSNCPCYFSANPYGGYLTAGFGANPITPDILLSTFTYTCRACPLNTFNPIPPALGSSSNVTDPAIGTCLLCPYGSSCASGAMVATRGFWGSSTGHLSAFRCPVGYCCDAEPCGSIDGCFGNRGGTLCGACAPGFAQTIDSTACRAVTGCGGTGTVWFVLGVLLLAALFAVYARISQARTAGSWPLNAIQPVAYFYQMAQLLPVSTASDSMQSVIASLFNMQVHSGGGGGFSCPFPSLTTLQDIELHYAIPVVVAALLAICYGVESRQYYSTDEKFRLAQGGTSPVELYQVSSMKALALAFSTVLITTFQLLHCVDLQPTAGNSVLFRSAVHACGAWQAPFYVLAALLLLPVVLALAAAAGVANTCTAKLSVPPAVSAKLQAPYRKCCGHWEAVQALHRVAVVVVYTFVGSVNSAVAAVLQTAVCMTALVVHLSNRPFATASANHAQTVLLSLLALVALINVPQAMLDTNAVAASAEAKALAGRFRYAEAALLLAPAVVMVIAVLALVWRQRRVLAHKVAAVCAAACAFIADLLPREDDEESQLGEPLIRNSQLTGNVTASQQTAAGDDGDGKH